MLHHQILFLTVTAIKKECRLKIIIIIVTIVTIVMKLVGIVTKTTIIIHNVFIAKKCKCDLDDNECDYKSEYDQNFV